VIGHFALVAAGMIVSAPADETAELTAIGYVVDVEVVQLFPVVRRKGAYVGGLTAADFVVYDDGEPVEIESFASDPVPLDIALVIDVSQSMDTDLRAVKRAALELLGRVESDDRLRVVAFNHQEVARTEPSSDRVAARAAIEGLEARGGTAIFQTVLEVIDDMPAVGARNVILLFSDGQDGHIPMLRRVTERALERGIVIYTAYAPGSSWQYDGRRHMALLPDRTGGTSHLIGSVGHLAAVFDEILIDLRQQYRMTFAPRPGPPGKRSIKVKTVARGLKVRHRKSYVHGER